MDINPSFVATPIGAVLTYQNPRHGRWRALLYLESGKFRRLVGVGKTQKQAIARLTETYYAYQHRFWH